MILWSKCRCRGSEALTMTFKIAVHGPSFHIQISSETDALMGQHKFDIRCFAQKKVSLHWESVDTNTVTPTLVHLLYTLIRGMYSSSKARHYFSVDKPSIKIWISGYPTISLWAIWSELREHGIFNKWSAWSSSPSCSWSEFVNLYILPVNYLYSPPNMIALQFIPYGGEEWLWAQSTPGWVCGKPTPNAGSPPSGIFI